MDAPAIPSELSGISFLLKGFAAPPANESGVYFLLKDGVIVYVGQSQHVASRVPSHLFGKDFDYVFYLPVHESQLDLVEMTWIKKLLPKYNAQGTGRRSIRPLREAEPRDWSMVLLRMSELCAADASGAAPPSVMQSQLPLWFKRSLVSGGIESLSDLMAASECQLLSIRGIGSRKLPIVMAEVNRLLSAQQECMCG